MCDELQLKSLLVSVVGNAKDIFGSKLHSVILYGSYARGDFDDESDVDIMIVADIPSDECWSYNKRLIEKNVQLEIDSDIVISTHTVDLTTFNKYRNVLPFYRNVTREGIKIAV